LVLCSSYCEESLIGLEVAKVLDPKDIDSANELIKTSILNLSTLSNSHIHDKVHKSTTLDLFS
jgi:hypothetical protein